VVFLLLCELWWGGVVIRCRKNIVSNLNMAFAEVAFKYGGASAGELMSHKWCYHRFINKILDIYFSLHGIAPCDMF
jgi:hypothetical protein